MASRAILRRLTAAADALFAAAALRGLALGGAAASDVVSYVLLACEGVAPAEVEVVVAAEAVAAAAAAAAAAKELLEPMRRSEDVLELEVVK